MSELKSNFYFLFLFARNVNLDAPGICCRWGGGADKDNSYHIFPHAHSCEQGNCIGTLLFPKYYCMTMDMARCLMRHVRCAALRCAALRCAVLCSNNSTERTCRVNVRSRRDFTAAVDGRPYNSELSTTRRQTTDDWLRHFTDPTRPDQTRQSPRRTRLVEFGLNPTSVFPPYIIPS